MFGIFSGKPALVLAPMEGVTDAPMRALLSERGGFTFCVSEFLRITDHSHHTRSIKRHLPEIQQDSRTTAGAWVQLQLLGGQAQYLAETALQAIELGVAGIDINFGCPAPTVNRNDGGATLLKYPHRIFEIISTIRKAVPSHMPVSAKLRLGWDNMEDIYTNALIAENAGASWITIHARTKTQGYRPPAYWEYIGETKRRLSIPVVANGEIWSLEDFKRCREVTNCEHFMIGRGALANPSLPLLIANELGIHPAASDVSALRNKSWDTPQEWKPLFERFSAHCTPFASNDHYNLRRIKQWMTLVQFKRDIPFFDVLKRTVSLEELFNEMDRLITNSEGP